MDEAMVDLSKYRLEQAEQCIKSAKLLIEASDYKGGQRIGLIIAYFIV
jgi:hypothetical protein